MTEDTSDTNMYKLICDIEHPIFDLVDNDTRRKILRLIACEHNYGNQIANILDLSTPAIHRHLKYLSGNNPNEISLIDVYEKTNVSHSGYKGGEAQLYKINAKIGMFYHIFPNFVHSHIIEMEDESNTILSKQDNEEPPHELLEPRKAIEKLGNEEYAEFLRSLEEVDEGSDQQKRELISNIGEEKVFSIYRHIYETLQRQNKKIRELEEELLDLMGIKNEFMGILDNILRAQPDLGYEERVILRAISCLGKNCSADLSHLMNMNQYMINQYVHSLREKNWIK